MTSRSRPIATLIGVSAVLSATGAQGQIVTQQRSQGAAQIQVRSDTPDLMAAHFLNVGQGSAAILEFSCGIMIVDTGGQADAATDWRKRFTDKLDELFARRTDLNRTIAVVYISHPHPDHTLGIPDLIAGTRYKILNVVVDAATTGKSLPAQKLLINYANAHVIPQVQIKTSMLDRRLGLTSANIDPLRCAGREPNIRVIWGLHDEPHHWPVKEEKDENNHSVAIRLEFGQSTFLMVGDMEEISQQAMVARYAGNPKILDTDIFLAGHHGSKNGTSVELVKAMSPEIAVMSSGNPDAKEQGFAAYQFGHPNKLAIDRLSDPTYGVSETRPVKNVAAGVSGANPSTHAPPTYVFIDVSKAIFDTGWDGDIVIEASRDGTKRVIID